MCVWKPVLTYNSKLTIVVFAIQTSFLPDLRNMTDVIIENFEMATQNGEKLFKNQLSLQHHNSIEKLIFY